MKFRGGRPRPDSVLTRRQREFDSIPSQGGGRKTGDKIVTTGSGKNRMYHRPGSGQPTGATEQPRVKFRRYRQKPDGTMVPA